MLKKYSGKLWHGSGEVDGSIWHKLLRPWMRSCLAQFLFYFFSLFSKSIFFCILDWKLENAYKVFCSSGVVSRIEISVVGSWFDPELLSKIGVECLAWFHYARQSFYFLFGGSWMLSQVSDIHHRLTVIWVRVSTAHSGLEEDEHLALPETTWDQLYYNMSKKETTA